jgi:hypothetical protein
MSLYVPCYRPYDKHNTNIHALGEIRTHNPSKLTAANRRLRRNLLKIITTTHKMLKLPSAFPGTPDKSSLNPRVTKIPV